MKKFLILLPIFILLSCSEESDAPSDRFINTYKEVLVIREMYPLDTALANRKVDSVFDAYSYTEPEFRRDYFRYSKNGKQFALMIDSLREAVKFEYDTLRNKK